MELARHVAEATVSKHRRVRSEWFAQARRDLTNLPLSLTEDIADRVTRVALRRQFEAQTAARIGELERLTEVAFSEPKLVGRIRVHAAADAGV